MMGLPDMEEQLVFLLVIPDVFLDNSNPFGATIGPIILGEN